MKPQTLWFLCIAVAIIGVLFGLGVPESDEGANSGVIGDGLRFRLSGDTEFAPAYDEYGRAVPAIDGENLASATKPMMSESIEFELALDAGIEYKALMSQGDSLVYEWQVKKKSGNTPDSNPGNDSAEVYYDFHAHPPDAHKDYFTRYKAGEAARDQGAIVAAISGQHGWYWLNISDAAVTIELRIAGFYEGILALPVD